MQRLIRKLKNRSRRSMTSYGRHQRPRRAARSLQALFITATAPTMSTVRVKMSTTEVATSPLRAPTPPTVNAQEGVKRLIAAQITR
jgi:hypothetical protein